MTGPAPGARPRPPLIPSLPRPAWVVLGGDFLSAVGSGLTLPCLFVYAHQVRHVGYTLSGLVVAAIALASLAGNPLGGMLADRLTARRTVMAGLVVSAAGSVALALARSAPELLGAAAGRYNGLGVLAFTTGFLLGPVGGTAVLSAAGGVLFALLTVACLGTAGAALSLGRRLAADVNTIEAP